MSTAFAVFVRVHSRRAHHSSNPLATMNNQSKPNTKSVHNVFERASQTLRFLFVTAALSTLSVSADASEKRSTAAGNSDAPIELASTGGGRVASPQVKINGIFVFVAAFVEREPKAQPVDGSHIDITLLEAGGRVIRSKTVNYWPREISQDKPGLASRSHFSARLKDSGKETAKVRLNFHNEPMSKCKLHAP